MRLKQALRQIRLSPNIRYGERPMATSQSLRNLLIQCLHCRRRYSLRIGQFDTIGRAKLCREIYKAIALRSGDWGGRPPD